MILRKNNINPTSEEVSFMVSFSSYDVWRWLNRHAVVLLQMDRPENSDKLEWSFDRSDYEENLVRDPYALGWLPSKHAKKMAAAHPSVAGATSSGLNVPMKANRPLKTCLNTIGWACIK